MPPIDPVCLDFKGKRDNSQRITRNNFAKAIGKIHRAFVERSDNAIQQRDVLALVWKAAASLRRRWLQRLFTRVINVRGSRKPTRVPQAHFKLSLRSGCIATFILSRETIAREIAKNNGQGVCFSLPPKNNDTISSANDPGARIPR